MIPEPYNRRTVAMPGGKGERIYDLDLNTGEYERAEFDAKGGSFYDTRSSSEQRGYLRSLLRRARRGVKAEPPPLSPRFREPGEPVPEDYLAAIERLEEAVGPEG